MPSQLAGQVALVTGSASGIGRAVAGRFVAEGARVVGLDRVAGADLPSDVYAEVLGDVRDVATLRRAVLAAVSRFGRLDVLVANAGIYDNRRRFRDYTCETLDTAFDELFSIDVKAYLLAARAALDALVAQRGCIIFTGSVSGSRAGFGGALYVAAKHAVHGLTRQLAFELAPEVRVNAVAPGYVPTGLRGLDSLAQGPSTGAPHPTQMPLQAIASADDFASAYVFLASDTCRRTASGTILDLDGGSGLRGPRPIE